MLSPDDPYNAGGSACQPGFVINGYSSGQNLGGQPGVFPNNVVIGDVNGDGIPDILISSAGFANPGGGRGSVFVVFGTTSGFPDPLPLNSLNGSNGFRLDMQNWYAIAGPVAIGDVNGDGINDIVMSAADGITNGSLCISADCGAVGVVFGKECGGTWSTACSASYTLNAAFFNGTNGFELDGDSSMNNFPNSQTLAVGDINGDGYADIALGAYYSNPGSTTEGGSVLVVFGKASGWPTSPTYITSLADGNNGFRLDGSATNQGIGYYSLAIGDINGDGYGDLLVTTRPNGGSVYVLFGKPAGGAKLGTSWGYSEQTLTAGSFPLDATNGFALTFSSGYQFPLAVGDVNGDGINDIVIGNTTYGHSWGNVYALFGQKLGGPKWGNPWPYASKSYTMVSGASPFDGTSGAEFIAPTQSCRTYMGNSVAVGDVNGDGIADIIVGASDSCPGTTSSQGSAYVIFGKTSGWSSTYTTLNSSFLNGVNGVEFDGVTSSSTYAGTTVAAGDLNGDGIADVIITAPDTSPGGFGDAGSAYVFFGRKAGWANLTPYALGNL